MVQLPSHDHGSRAGGGHARVPFLRSRGGLAFGFLMLVAAGLLLTGHQAHLLAAAPFLLLAACPLMHLFMHHGHGGHGGADDQGGGS